MIRIEETILGKHSQLKEIKSKKFRHINEGASLIILKQLRKFCSSYWPVHKLLYVQNGVNVHTSVILASFAKSSVSITLSFFKAFRFLKKSRNWSFCFLLLYLYLENYLYLVYYLSLKVFGWNMSWQKHYVISFIHPVNQHKILFWCYIMYDWRQYNV